MELERHLIARGSTIVEVEDFFAGYVTGEYEKLDSRKVE